MLSELAQRSYYTLLFIRADLIAVEPALFYHSFDNTSSHVN